MKDHSRRRSAPLFVCLLCLTGAFLACRLPARSVPPRPWLLSPIPGEPTSGELFASVGVGPVDFPEYLNRPEIIERVGPNELRPNEFEVWGESLRTNFRETLSSNLSLLVPGISVVSFPWKGPSRVDYRLAVVVARFEHDVPSGRIVLDAGWALRRASDGRKVASRTRAFREPVQGEGYAAVTAAMSLAVATLSRDVATKLETIPELRN